MAVFTVTPTDSIVMSGPGMPAMSQPVHEPTQRREAWLLPLAEPYANLFGQVSPTMAARVAEPRPGRAGHDRLRRAEAARSPATEDRDR